MASRKNLKKHLISNTAALWLIWLRLQKTGCKDCKIGNRQSEISETRSEATSPLRKNKNKNSVTSVAKNSCLFSVAGSPPIGGIKDFGRGDVELHRQRLNQRLGPFNLRAARPDALAVGHKTNTNCPA
jgi:hypothetical protein